MSLSLKHKSLLEKNLYNDTSIHFPIKTKRHPCAPSFRASYTVEAAVVLPIFLGLMIFAIFYLRILQVEYLVQRALDETSQQVAAVCNEKTVSLSEVVVLCNAKIKKYNTPVSFIQGGMLGLSYQESKVEGNYIELRVRYQMAFPLNFFGKLRWNKQQQSINRKWMGWDSSEKGEHGKYVFVTTHGEAYHYRLKCPYLNPSIHTISYKEVSKKRNEGGEKYQACRGCGARKVKSGVVYITKYGEVYHRSLHCIGLRRSIHRVLITEVLHKRACGKCAKE